MVIATLAVMAGAQTVSSVVGAHFAKKSNRAQRRANEYNARLSYKNAIDNIKSRTKLSMFNSEMQLNTARTNSKTTLLTADFNAKVMSSVTGYNNDLLEEDLNESWRSAGLDLFNISNARARERGTIIANQAASGTVIGEGSNAAVIIDQMTQESLDSFIVMHGADVRAAKISNAIAKSRWGGDMAIRKTMWEGNLRAATITANAANGAMSSLVGTTLRANAAEASANNALTAGMSTAKGKYDANSNKITSDLVTGLIGGAGTAVNAIL